MAIKGSITIQGNIQVQDAYLRLGGISGGKQSGYWAADIQVFSDGGTAAQAYEASVAAYAADQTKPVPDPSAMDAVRVLVNLPHIQASFDPAVLPCVALYATLKALYPTLTNA